MLKPTKRSEKSRERLSKLSDASLSINSSLDLNTTLQAVVDGARSLTDAKYGALLVFDSCGTVQDFVTSGVSSKEQRDVGSWPKAVGLLGHLRERREPLRLRDLADHSTTVGFPPNHPPMKSFLGMPIWHHEQLFGSIYLTEKETVQEFTVDDEDTIVRFASQAAMAISNALKYRAEQRAKSDLEALLNASPLAVLAFDANTGNVLSINEETKRFIRSIAGKGGSVEHLLGGLTFRRADGREYCLAEFPLVQVLKSGETVQAEKIVISLSDGRTVTTLVNARPIYSDDGGIVSVVVTFQDITRLHELENLRADFLCAVDSELRAPLNTIKGSTATVLDSPYPLNTNETRQFFRIIDEQTNHIRERIGNLLDATRIEAGSFSISPEPTDIATSVFEAKEAFQGGGFKGEIIVDKSADLPLVMADRQSILRVLHNLFSFGARHSIEASTILVTISGIDTHVTVKVTYKEQDTSTIRPSQQFQDLSGTAECVDLRRIEGAGLGLTVCNGIVEAHGGSISIESSESIVGTSISFTIPVAEDTKKIIACPNLEQSPNAAQVESQQGRILAIIDDPHLQEYIRDVLLGEGYVPITTGTPDVVNRLIREEKPCLVLLDHALSGTNGFEVIKTITEITDAPVILLSEYGNDRIIEKLFELGASDYIVRPFSPTELIARITAALRRKVVSDRTQTLEPYVLGELGINYAER